MAASPSTQTPKAEQFDLTLNDDMNDAQDGLRKVLAEQEQANLERKIAIAQQITNHLGPHSSTADQSYVARLAEFGRKGRQRRSRSKRLSMEVSNDQQQPPPPPGPAPIIISGGRAPKATRIIIKMKTAPPRRGRSQNPNEAMAIEPGPPPPGPPPPPAV